MSPDTPAKTPDHRAAQRVLASDMPAITGVRLSSNDAVSKLVNISTSGVLVECTSKPRPGTAVTVNFIGTFSPSVVRGRVARTIVASLGKDGTLRYMVGIAFDQPIDLPEPDEAEGAVEDSAPAARPVSFRLQNRW
jgi:hypothetical protein